MEEQDPQSDAPESGKWPLKDKTIKLANKKDAVSESHVNIGAEFKVFFPPADVQKAGFAPYYIDRETRKPVDATTLVLSTFPGIYLLIKPK